MSNKTKPQKQRTQITHLLGNPSLTHQQIASAVGVSTKTVQRVAQEIRPDMEQVEAQLAEYQSQLRERLPIKDRVALYETIARRAESNPFAAMRALERADELDGILTAKDEIRRPAPSGRDHSPMFILPEGTRVQVNVDLRTHAKKEIDVTPHPDDGKSQE